MTNYQLAVVDGVLCGINLWSATRTPYALVSLVCFVAVVLLGVSAVHHVVKDVEENS